MLDTGWIKLHRKLLNWEWYDDIATTRLFVHLLLTVNIEDDNWHGVHVPRGSRITSRAILAKETNLSEQQVRTALKHLISTNEVTKQITNRYALISVVNFDFYQTEQPANQPTINQVPTNNQPTTNQQSNQVSTNKMTSQSSLPDTPFLAVNHGFAQTNQPTEYSAINQALFGEGSENQPQNKNKEDKNKEDKKNIYIYTREEVCRADNGEKKPPQKRKASKPKAEKVQYAEFVAMTAEEHQKLVDDFGEPFVEKCIEILDNYKGSSGKKYKDDYRAILSWVVEECEKRHPGLKKQNQSVSDDENPFASYPW